MLYQISYMAGAAAAYCTVAFLAALFVYSLLFRSRAAFAAALTLLGFLIFIACR
jgi:hypothetical protein